MARPEKIKRPAKVTNKFWDYEAINKGGVCAPPCLTIFLKIRFLFCRIGFYF